MAPSWTATTEALGALTSSTSRGASGCPPAAPLTPAAAAEGEGAVEGPGVAGWGAPAPVADAPLGIAVAFAVALEEGSEGTGPPQEIFGPVTGRRASIRPVSDAIVDFG